MKYVKKRVAVDAFQLTKKNWNDVGGWPEWLRKELEEGTLAESLAGAYTIRTLEGNLTVTPGDFIIKGVAGEIYPCKPGIFHDTYDLVRGPQENLDVCNCCGKEFVIDDEGGVRGDMEGVAVSFCPKCFEVVKDIGWTEAYKRMHALIGTLLRVDEDGLIGEVERLYKEVGDHLRERGALKEPVAVN